MEARSVLRDLPRGRDDLLGSAQVSVAVLDGPVDMSHPCFAGASLSRVGTLVDEPAGRGPMSQHGTHVTSLIFGQPNSPVVGVAPRTRGLLLPVFRDREEGRVPQLDLARAIERAVHEGAHVINISGGERSPDGEPDSLLARALQLCEDSGVLVVAAVGNDGCDCLQVPAAVPSVLAVGAAGANGDPLEINNWGSAYRANGVLAPGQDIEGAAPAGGLQALTGSSFAAALVSGVAALLVAAQLDDGQAADPLAAGRAILESALPSPCSPSDAPSCRRHLAGALDAAAAHRLVTGRDGAGAAGPEAALVLPAPVLVRQAQGAFSGSGVNAAGASSAQCGDPSDSNKGDSSMDTQNLRAASSGDAEQSAPVNGDGGASPAPPGSVQPAAQQPQAAGTSSGINAAGGSPPEPASLPGGHGEDGVMDSPVSQASSGGEGAAPAAAPPRPIPPPAQAPVSSGADRGVRSSSCGCGGSDASSCSCKETKPHQPLVFAIGNIGYDFRTEAGRDSFVQLMPRPKETDPQGLRSSLPANPYNPLEMYSYLAENPWESDKLTWTLTMDNTPVYALEAEIPVAMDWSRQIVVPDKGAGSQPGSPTDHDQLSQLLDTLSHPPVSFVYRTFRDAIKGQVTAVSEGIYEISRVSIPGVLTDRTVQLYSGQIVPVVQVQSRGLFTWAEGDLVDAVVGAVSDDIKTNSTPVTVTDADLRKYVRAFLDKIYYQFRNLGQSSADRALNAAATNAFLFGDVIKNGLLSAKHVPGPEDRLYSLDTISVSKSPFCRPGSNCQEVRVTFFDPENERRARVTYQFTMDVSEPYAISIAPVHVFTEST
ncbi:S8 family serine peptidase [Streptomyces olivoreticuli]